MIYLSAVLFAALLWWLPWWSLVPVAAWLGWQRGAIRGDSWKAACGAGLVWSALAFIKDGQNNGVVSRRLAGLFGIGSPAAIFALVFILGFVTVFLSFKAAASLTRK